MMPACLYWSTLSAIIFFILGFAFENSISSNMISRIKSQLEHAALELKICDNEQASLRNVISKAL